MQSDNDIEMPEAVAEVHGTPTSRYITFVGKPTWLPTGTKLVTADQLRAAVRAAVLRERERGQADAARYRWLRDVSVPPHNFYISVPDEFADERYTPAEVDAAIDAARKERP